MKRVQYHPEYTTDYLGKMLRSRRERLLRLGFFKSEKDLEKFSDDLIAAKESVDIIWRYGLLDVMDEASRTLEVRNWLKYISSPSSGLGNAR